MAHPDIVVEKNLRAYPGVERGSTEWEETYKIRVNVEKSINHFKEVYPYFFRHKKITVPTAPMSVKTVIVSARSGVRTLDTLIKSQVLYQLS